MKPTEEFDYRKYLGLIMKKRHQFVVVALAITTAIMVYSYFLPEKYEARSAVFIEKSVIGDLVRGIAVTPSMEDKIRVLTYAMKSRSLLMKVFDDLGMNVAKMNSAQVERMVKSFQERTDVKLKDREGLFIISFTDENPRLARDYVNALVRRYIEDNVAAKREESYGATKFLGEQIAAVKDKLEKAEARVNAYKRDNGILITSSQDTVLNEISDAEHKLEDLTIRRSQLEGMRNMAMQSDPQQAKLAALQKRLRDLTVVYTDNYPEVIDVRNSIAAIKAQMKTTPAGELVPANPQELEKIKMELKAVREMEQGERRFIGSKRTLLARIPAAKTSLDELEREMNTQKSLYEQLMTRYSQSEVSKQIEVQDKATTFRIVDPAIMPVKPVWPNRVKFILLAIAAGVLGSFGILALGDYLDTSIRGLDAMKSIGVPILAVVPRIEDPEEQRRSVKRDRWFFTAAGAYFCLILAVLTMEVMRDTLPYTLRPADIGQQITRIVGQFIR